jgi:bifunctional UDP-N-acetylglucosamine pyrophosphorylase/glucosamine-1-phosphate N-acetyltransferase
MPQTRLAIIVLAAGKGTRMQSDLPKVMHKLAERPMLRHVLDACERLDPWRIVVVVGTDMPSVEAFAKPHPVAIQHEQRGTGHAVAAAQPAFEGESFDDVLVVYGDTPLITSETLARMVRERRITGAAAVVLGMRVDAENAYGRLVLDGHGNLVEIVEAAEATPQQLAITLCNSGVMAIDGSMLFDLVGRLSADNAKGEYYLTDVVALACQEGGLARVVEAGVEELVGVNSRADQAIAEAILQRRLRAAAMAGGATLIDPDTVYLCADTIIGRDVVIGPNVVIGPGVTLQDRVEIKAFCHIDGAIIRAGAIIGPFARLRPGADVGEDAHIGNFVELKNTKFGRGAKANHLSYLGDAEIGEKANIGAGTITCNYDGFFKYRTVIGAGAFIGTNTSLVAPITLGDGAMTAAGSVVTTDVAPDATAIGRAPQIDKPGHAARFRETKRRAKAAAARTLEE